AQRFSKSPGDDINLAENAKFFDRSATRLPQRPCRVRLVHKQQRIMPLSKRDKITQRGEQTFHREHSIGRNDLDAIVFAAVLFEHFAQMIYVAVSIEPGHGLFGHGSAETNPVDDAGMIELIAVDDVLVVALPKIV